MSQLKTNSIANVAGTASTDVLNVINGSAKAWVNFNGTGTVAIRQGYNVSSVTDNGAGDYTVNFTNALADANYATVCTQSVSGAAATSSFGPKAGADTDTALVTYSTTQVRVFLMRSSGTANDITAGSVAIFR